MSFLVHQVQENKDDTGDGYNTVQELLCCDVSGDRGSSREHAWWTSRAIVLGACSALRSRTVLWTVQGPAGPASGLGKGRGSGAEDGGGGGKPAALR